MSPAHAQLSSVNDEHYTPVDVAERARRVLGPIDLDPASDAFGNQLVHADRFITREEDGLVADWGEPATIFLNPPGGKRKNRSNTMRFWGRLMTQRQLPTFHHAIFLAFNLEALQATQRPGLVGLSIAEYPFCVPRQRLRFLDGEGVEQRSPTRANAIVYVPGRRDARHDFIREFSDLGVIVNPWAHPVMAMRRDL